MRISHLALASTIALLPFAVTACGSDDDTPGSGGSGAQGGTAGSGAGGSGADGGSGAMGGSAGTGAQGGTAGNGGTAGTGGGSCDLSGTGLAHADVTAPAAGQTVTLTSDKVWDLKGKVNVGDGSTLVIEPCTRIEGDGASLGTLVIQQGGKIMAQGTETDPILFTSALPAGSRAPGDWGGVIVLGKAPNFKISGTDLPSIEGLNPGEGLYGGNEPADNSGVMTYVRIEYSGVEIGDGNEINGLTLGSVGSGTTLHHIMVSNTLDDCFEWFGGTVNAHHLVCNNAGDDMFDMDQGFQGSVQFLFGRQVAPISDDPNGWECDSDKGGATPVSQVTASNVTLCGLGTDPANPQYGAVFRENLEGDYGNMLFKGFEASFDVRDDAGTASNPKVKVHDTTVKGVTEDIAYDEMGSADNDSGFDERAWFNGGTGNSVADPGIDCGSAGVAPNPIPATAITGGTPLTTGAAGTATGFDTSATYQGGFGTENWMSAPWCDWAAN